MSDNLSLRTGNEIGNNTGTGETKYDEPTSPKPGPRKAARSRRANTRLFLFALVPVALVIGGYAYVTGGQVMTTDNAYIGANIVGVTTDISGLVKSIDVHEGEAVKAGQVLFTLDPRSFQIAVDGDKAKLGAARDQILNLQASYQQSLVELAQAQADLPYYQTNLERQQRLQNTSASTQANLDDAQHALIAAREKVDVAKAAVSVVLAQLGGKADAPVESYPVYLEAKAALDDAQRQLDHATVRAPFNGIVTQVSSLQVGSYMTASQAAFELVSNDNMWIDSNPKETELTYVRPGQDVTITVDTYPGTTWHGKVDSISPASSSSFSLLPAQNSSGNWVKVVQRIPMRVSITDATNKPPLRVGMSTEVSIDTGHARGLPDFIGQWFGAKTANATEASPMHRAVSERVK
ncbi:HlyD family secretion protein [Rhizobium oryziradicis]|uniref:Hemolysin secretion protein D n=1 Tax=Rhizobium oryziradicis TaxID=1867956 RepID=A0A1Q8ZM62_9HYPH|nr:HlyD family secretion protein [Rhizobium oryziradicis]OLP42965.1 hemolysin secretion protein D [Rhizobium oryziradicis]